jgi:hypothetical protein
MQKTNTMSSPALDLARSDWSCVEAWIDPMLSPHVSLLGDRSGSYRIHDPAECYRIVFTSASYEEAQT